MSRPPAGNSRGASLDNRYGILIVRMTGENMLSGEISRKKVDPGNERGPPESSRLYALVRT